MDSKNIHEVFERISNCIASSKSILQLETAEKMVELFRRQQSHPELSEKLDVIFMTKAGTLHYFEWKQFRDFGQEAA